MLSRIADSLYWMARYLERVDDTARLIEINLLHLLEAEEDVAPETHWRPLLGISGNAVAYAELHPDGRVTQDRVIRFLTRERTNPNAMRAACGWRATTPASCAIASRRRCGRSMNELWLRAVPHLDRSDGARLDDPVLSLRAQRGGALPRSHRQHDDARRGVRLLSARHLRRARRHDGTHPRREVPPAAARALAGGLGARLLPVGGAAEVALGVRGLSPPPPGRLQSARRWRSSSSCEPEFPRSLRFCRRSHAQALATIDVGRETSATARVVTMLADGAGRPGRRRGLSRRIARVSPALRGGRGRDRRHAAGGPLPRGLGGSVRYVIRHETRLVVPGHGARAPLRAPAGARRRRATMPPRAPHHDRAGGATRHLYRRVREPGALFRSVHAARRARHPARCGRRDAARESLRLHARSARSGSARGSARRCVRTRRCGISCSTAAPSRPMAACVSALEPPQWTAGQPLLEAVQAGGGLGERDVRLRPGSERRRYARSRPCSSSVPGCVRTSRTCW